MMKGIFDCIDVLRLFIYGCSEGNPYRRINFDGGDLSSDAGLLLIKEFAEKIGLVKLIKDSFCLGERKTQNAKTLHADLLLASITQLITVVVADRIVSGDHGFHLNWKFDLIIASICRIIGL